MSWTPGMVEEPDRTLLDVRGLSVDFQTATGTVSALRDVSFSLGRERLGIVGESGSGKSTIGRAILRISGKNSIVRADRLQLSGSDLLRLSDRQMREVRGRQVTMVMQDPRYSLNPVLKIGAQLAESCRAHSSMGKAEAWQQAIDMLAAVHIREPARVVELYPHQLSGGMGQRVMIAMMLIPNPDLLIADEPTSALDVTVQRQILRLLDKLVAERGMGLIFISHDLNVVSGFCDRILIMYKGRIVESCAADQLSSARHPYTRGLLNCAPAIDRKTDKLKVLVRDAAWER